MQEKIFHLSWVQHKREGTSGPAATPLLLRLLFCWQKGILFWQKKKTNIQKKWAKKENRTKQNCCLFWNNNLCRGEKGDTSPPSMKKKTKAGTTTSIPVHLVGGNWIKSSCPEVKIVPLHVFVDLNQRLLAIQLFLPWAVFYSCNPRCQSLLGRY